MVNSKSSCLKQSSRRAFGLSSGAVWVLIIGLSTPAAADKLPRAALATTFHTGLDMEPEFQFGFAVDGYLRLSPLFSMGLRIGFVNTLNIGYDLPIVPQIPLDMLFSWDFPLRSGRVLIPFTIGAGVSFLPAYSHEMIFDMFTLETGVKIRLAKQLWLTLTAGSRAFMYYNFNYGGYVPEADFRFLTGPYIRF